MTKFDQLMMTCLCVVGNGGYAHAGVTDGGAQAQPPSLEGQFSPPPAQDPRAHPAVEFQPPAQGEFQPGRPLSGPVFNLPTGSSEIPLPPLPTQIADGASVQTLWLDCNSGTSIELHVSGAAPTEKLVVRAPLALEALAGISEIGTTVVACPERGALIVEAASGYFVRRNAHFELGAAKLALSSNAWIRSASRGGFVVDEGGFHVVVRTFVLPRDTQSKRELWVRYDVTNYNVLWGGRPQLMFEFRRQASDSHFNAVFLEVGRGVAELEEFVPAAGISSGPSRKGEAVLIVPDSATSMRALLNGKEYQF